MTLAFQSHVLLQDLDRHKNKLVHKNTQVMSDCYALMNETQTRSLKPIVMYVTLVMVLSLRDTQRHVRVS